MDKKLLEYDTVIDGIIVKEIAEELKLKLNMPNNLDMDTYILLDQVIILVIKMYLSKDIRTKVVQ